MSDLFQADDGRIVTKDGITVKAGQRWRSIENQRRMKNERIVLITRVADGFAWYGIGTQRIRIDRMHKHATGWELVADPAPLELES